MRPPRKAAATKPKCARHGGLPLQVEIESTFLLEKSKIAEDILFDLLRLRLGIDLLQIRDDLLDGVLAVAALNNFEAWPIQAERAFRHEQHALLVVFPKAASGSQARAAMHLSVHAVVSRTNRRASSSPE